MPSELIELTVAQAAERIRSRELSAVEYFDAWRERAASDSLNAYLWTAEDAGQADLEGSRAAREEVDGRSLAGIPIAVKDIFCTARASSRATARPTRRRR
jgi:aspartyl-tRNA(Asn)/glutamyl-tRNA(Gln) amidotransferase subunit A